jgi:hypothetical protein
MKFTWACSFKTNSVGQFLAWRANNHSDGQEISLLYNSEDNYLVCKSPPLDPILSQMNVFKTLIPQLDLIISSDLHLISQGGLFHSYLPANTMHEFCVCAMHATWPVHLILGTAISILILVSYSRLIRVSPFVLFISWVFPHACYNASLSQHVLIAQMILSEIQTITYLI